MTDMVYDWGRDKLVSGPDGGGSVKQTQCVIISDGRKTSKVMPAYEPPIRLLTVSRGHDDYDPFGHLR